MTDRARQRSLYCRAGDRALIRGRAEAAGKTVSGYLLDLAASDDPDRHPVALTPGEQAELRDGVRELLVLARGRTG